MVQNLDVTRETKSTWHRLTIFFYVTWRYGKTFIQALEKLGKERKGDDATGRRRLSRTHYGHHVFWPINDQFIKITQSRIICLKNGGKTRFCKVEKNSIRDYKMAWWNSQIRRTIINFSLSLFPVFIWMVAFLFIGLIRWLGNKKGQCRLEGGLGSELFERREQLLLYAGIYV